MHNLNFVQDKLSEQLSQTVLMCCVNVTVCYQHFCSAVVCVGLFGVPVVCYCYLFYNKCFEFVIIAYFPKFKDVTWL